MDYIGGHNIMKHDLTYLAPLYKKVGCRLPQIIIDTLYLSPLLFPERPYHRLLKDDKLLTDSLNNPLNDSIKAFLNYFRKKWLLLKRLDEDLKIYTIVF